MTVAGYILLLIGGGLLHDVPFLRFFAALSCILIGTKLVGL